MRATFGKGADPRSQYEYWASRKDPLIRFRNCGLPGARTDQIAFQLDRCLDGAGALVVEGGVNDIAQALQLGPAAQRLAVRSAARNLKGIVQRAKHLGLPVAITDVLPWNFVHPAADRSIARLNRRVRAIGRQEDIPVLPFHATLADPQHPELMRRGWTDDGTHPSIEGYRRLGELAFRLP